MLETEIEITNVTYPEMLEYGPEFKIEFELEKTPFTNPENLNVIFTFNNMETNWEFKELEPNQGFSIDLDKSVLNTKNNKFVINTEFYDRNNKKYVKTYEQLIPINDVNFFDKIMMWFNMAMKWVESLF